MLAGMEFDDEDDEDDEADEDETPEPKPKPTKKTAAKSAAKKSAPSATSVSKSRPKPKASDSNSAPPPKTKTKTKIGPASVVPQRAGNPLSVEPDVGAEPGEEICWTPLNDDDSLPEGYKLWEKRHADKWWIKVSLSFYSSTLITH